MKKRTRYIIICCIMALLMVTAIVFAALIGSGIIEASTAAKYIFIGMAVICGVISSIALRASRKQKQEGNNYVK